MSENIYKKIFSDNLKHYMEINQKTQIDLVNDLNLDKSTVSTWCNGSRLPRMDKVNLLAQYFGINRSDLIEESQTTDKDELILWASTALSNETEEFRQRLVNVLSQLDVNEWKILSDMAEALVKHKQKKD